MIGLHCFFKRGFLALFISLPAWAQQSVVQQPLWHGTEREIHYRPDGDDFLLVNGKKRFNRALYGTNTGFRVEAGDLPEFALYMPGMGGNLKFGLISGNADKWLMDATGVNTRYRPGSMLYEIKDPLLGNAVLHLHVLALAEADGLIVKASVEGEPGTAGLLVAFGGATGSRFSRDGDIGADPESSFYLNAEYCRGNIYSLKKNTFQLSYGAGKTAGQLKGVFPSGLNIQLSDAARQESPLALLRSRSAVYPVATGLIPLKKGQELYFLVKSAGGKSAGSYSRLKEEFRKAEQARMKLVARVKVNTPDPYINTLGGALAVAADAIWEDPTYLHGAVAWRMRLNAWRGAYAADPLGWHDRAEKHFTSYAASQVLQPESGPVTPDTALHMARQLEKMGTALFSSGYISRNPNDNTRPHHYDMNLVFFDQMLSHFYWTGDRTFIRQMWPAIKRHLAWEKRNFDMDGDGLYDAYCAIWASDALQYSGGGVTHTSAYNYRANRIAARLAALLGEDPAPYQQEADKIGKAVNAVLWMPKLGWYAEYKDLLGLKKLHPAPGLWTIYHAIDSDVPDMFQSWQSLRYIDTQIPRIPVRAKGLSADDLYTLPTTNWQPYTWSVNNVALAEVLHTSLAYWQAGRHDDAFKLWRSNMIETMYLSSSPGGFQQLSFYDAQRGELYRDFADPIGVAARTLVEGLFGIRPDALADTLTVRPGLPSSWDHASLHIPDLSFDFKREGNRDLYTLVPSFKKQMHLHLLVPARSVAVHSVKVNGEPVVWKSPAQAMGSPMLELAVPKANRYEIEITWEGIMPDRPLVKPALDGEPFSVAFESAVIEDYYDPQDILSGVRIVNNNSLNVDRLSGKDHKTIFIKVRQRDFSWWVPVPLTVKPVMEISAPVEQGLQGLTFTITNNERISRRLNIYVNPESKAYSEIREVGPRGSVQVNIPAGFVIPGTNTIRVQFGRGGVAESTAVNWNAFAAGNTQWHKVDLRPYFNDNVTAIFKNKYLSPRPASPTLQLPWQGIGNWCYPLTEATIDDSGIRRFAYQTNELRTPNQIPLGTPGGPGATNILFTSLWDNYPDSASVPLSGRASHMYLMLAGSTNPMQSRTDNGEVMVYYTDNTFARLALRNPENWWPVEQDYYTDGYAFTTDAARPYRVSLKTGAISRTPGNYTVIKGFSNYGIDGGAATVVDLPLDPSKDLKEIRLKTLANDVVIGLMSVTLVR